MIYKKINHSKLKLLFLNILIFSILYLILDDSNFNGINIVEDKIEDKILTKEVEKKVNDIEVFNNKEIASKENIKKAQEDINISKIKPSFFIIYFNRLYYSVTSACLLGFGDIYPSSLYCKLLTMIQSLITVSIIVY